MSLSLVYLVRADATAHALLAQFVAAYAAAPPGIVPNELILACKGFNTAGLAGLAAIYQRVFTPRVLSLPDVGFDQGSYRRACLVSKSRFVCVLNSYSRPLAAGWLAKLYDVARRPGVGIAGATGSHEITPHIRTTSFCLERDRFLRIVTVEPKNKTDCYALETGPKSFTREVRAAGLTARVVGRNGDADLDNAKELGTYRWRNQENLLVADNRTDDFAAGAPAHRRYLQNLAWGQSEY